MGGFNHSKGQSKSKAIPFTKEEMEAAGINLDIAAEQLSSILNQKKVQSQLTELFRPILQQQAKQLGESSQVADAALQRLLQITEGGGVSVQQSQLLDEALERQISGIRESTRQNLELVQQELAPAMGLRSGDSPIIDRGARLAEAGIQAENTARAQRAQAEIALPFQEGSFLQSLADQDFMKRMQFGQAQQQGGLGIANIGNIAAQQASLKPTVINKSGQEGFGFSLG